ncbi:MAG: SH3 domain-containing protein [Christensenellales bacterium]
MRKSLSASLALLLLALLLFPLGRAAAEEFVVAAPFYLNTRPEGALRAAAGGEAAVLRRLAPGEPLELLSLAGEWAEVRCVDEAGEALLGYLAAGDIRLREPGDGFSRATVNTGSAGVRLPLRAQPRASAASLGRYYTGVTAQVLEQPRDGWVKVRVGDLAGYFVLESVLLDAPAGSVPSAIPTVTVQNPDDPGLNLRAAQSFQADTKATYSNGEQLRVLGVTENFVHVLTGSGLTGFMMAWGVSPQLPAADAAAAVLLPEPGGIPTRIKNPAGQGAHLRQEASASSGSLGLFRNGTAVIVTGGGQYWKQVWVQGQTGWMMARLLEGMEPAEAGN